MEEERRRHGQLQHVGLQTQPWSQPVWASLLSHNQLTQCSASDQSSQSCFVIVKTLCCILQTPVLLTLT